MLLKREWERDQQRYVLHDFIIQDLINTALFKVSESFQIHLRERLITFFSSIEWLEI